VADFIRTTLKYWIFLALAGLALRATLTSAEELPAGSEAGPRRSLAECIALALEHHPALKSADAVVDAAGQRVWQAASPYLPQLNAGYNVDRRHTSTGARTGLTVASPALTFTFYNTAVSLTQVLFDFGQTLNQIRAAQASQRSLEADASTRRADVVLGVKQAYFQLLAARRMLAVADANVVQSRQQRELADGRHRVGFAPRFDVTQAEVQLATTELDQITAQNNLDLARETLRNAMGLSGPLDFEPLDSLDVYPRSIDDQTALDTAYRQRHELQSLYEQQRANEQRIAALYKDFLPSVVGSGTYQWSGSDYPLESNWNLGAAVSMPVFNGGLTIGQVGEAKANLAKLRFDEEALRLDIALEVRQALLEIGRARQAILVAEKGVQQARENLSLAEGRYRTGVGNFLEVTAAQASRSGAEASYVRSLYSYKTAQAALERATAKEWETE